MYIPEITKHQTTVVNTNEEIALAYLQFNNYVKTLSVIKQMSLLCRAIQKHRGLSMSMLVGYQQFRPELDALQHQVTRRIRLLATFTYDSIEKNEIEKIQASWQTIANNWQDDDVLVNFELHSFFIEQLFDVMMHLAKQLTLPFVGKIFQDSHSDVGEQTPVLSSLTPNHLIHYFSVMNFCCQQMPLFTEVLAKLRGIGAYVINRDVEDDLVNSKLRYFLQSARAQHQVLISAIEQYSKADHHAIITPAELSENEEKLKQLFSYLENDVLGKSGIELNSREFFDNTSEVIDVYWQVVDQGLTLMTKWQEESLEQWFCAQN